MSSYIRTVPELIAHFGGLTRMAIVLRTSPQNIVHWRTKGRIPAVFYKVHRKQLEAANRDLKVSDDLWGFRDPAQLSSPRRRASSKQEAAE
jgi:hypothetical protein